MKFRRAAARTRPLRWFGISLGVIFPAIAAIGSLLWAISNYAHGQKLAEPVGELILSVIIFSFGVRVCFLRPPATLSEHSERSL